MIKGRQSGQILLVVVLTMIVALTVGLSIAARVVTELKISKQNEESQRAFQAAEAGIQQSLESKDSFANINLKNNSFFTTNYNDAPNSVVVVNNGLDVDQSVGADVWLSDYSATQSSLFANPMGGGAAVPITIYWGESSQTSCASTGDNVVPAIEVVMLKGPLASPTIQKSIYEGTDNTGIPCSGRITNAINGTTAGGPFSITQNNSTVLFRNTASLLFDGSSLSNGLIMKVIPIFNSSKIALRANINFPSQGSTVDSTGTSGDTVRKVEYFQSNPQLPLEVFPYSLISQ